MREIKFRYWDGNRMFEVKRFVFTNIDSGRLYQLEGYHKNNSVPTASMVGELSTQDTQLIMQFTGLKDKNGVEIYEGDIVKNKKIGGDYHIGEIIISPTQGVVVGNWPIGFEKKTEVIGNIYENPELLEANK